MTVNPAREIKEAVHAWQDGESSRFEFAVIADGVVGGYEEGATKELAAQIKRSVATVQNYAKAGKLWKELLQADGGRAEIIRDALPISYCVKLASLYYNGTLGRSAVWTWFDRTIKQGWTVEEFYQQLPRPPKVDKPLIEIAEKWAGDIEYYIVNAPMLDIDPQTARRINRAGKLLAGQLRKVAK